MGTNAPATIHPPYPPSRKRIKAPPSYTDKTVVETPGDTGFVLTVAVAKSWHFSRRADMQRFREQNGLFA